MNAEMHIRGGLILKVRQDWRKVGKVSQNAGVATRASFLNLGKGSAPRLKAEFCQTLQAISPWPMSHISGYRSGAIHAISLDLRRDNAEQVRSSGKAAPMPLYSRAQAAKTLSSLAAVEMCRSRGTCRRSRT